MTTFGVFAVAADRVTGRLAAEVKAVRQQELHDIAAAKAEHASLPANYWHERYRVEAKLRAARAIREALRP